MNKHELKLLAIALVAMGTVGNDATNKNNNEKYNCLDESKEQYTKSKPKVYVKGR